MNSYKGFPAQLELIAGVGTGLLLSIIIFIITLIIILLVKQRKRTTHVNSNKGIYIIHANEIIHAEICIVNLNNSIIL